MENICVYILLLVIIFVNSLSHDEIVCVIQYSSWIKDEELTIGWTFDSSLEYNNDIICEASFRFTDKKPCNCSQINRWSCTLVVSKTEHFMHILENFNITVSLKSKTNNNELFFRKLNIDPLQCAKPPPVHNVTAITLNSYCVQVTWTYNENTFCFLEVKYCQIIHRRIDEMNWTSLQNHTVTVSDCQGTMDICRLTPYTQYQFTTQCKFVVNEQPCGQFTNICVIATASTLQDVPTGAPYMHPCVFHYISKSNNEDAKRTLEIYWQDVPTELKNGEITHFIVSIYERTPDRKLIKNAELPGNVYHTNVTLSNDMSYDFEIQAKTIAGISSNRSKLEIPIFRVEDGETVRDIIPVMKEQALHVHLDIADDKNPERVIVWCLKDDVQHCKSQSPITLTKAIFSSSSFVFTMPLATQLYRYSIGVVDGNNGIKWARCFYTTTEEVNAPRDVQIIPYPHALLVQWNNPLCENKPAGPYVAGFVVHICHVLKDNDSICIGKNTSHSLNGTANSFYAHGLETRSIYRMCLVAIGINNQHSDSTSCVYGQPYDMYIDLDIGTVAGITLGAIIVLALAVLGVIYSYRHIHTYCKMCVQRANVNMADMLIYKDET